MVLIATPLHDIACPVVFIENIASLPLPDFLGEAVAEIAEHYARTTLPEYSLYKYACAPSNLVDEAKALAPLGNAAISSINIAVDPLRLLTELPGPGKAVIRHLINIITSEKPCNLKKQAQVFKSLLPIRRPYTLDRISDKKCTTFLLSEPILGHSEHRLHYDNTGGLVGALVGALDIHVEPTTNLPTLDDEEKNAILSKGVFKPQTKTLPSTLPSFPSMLEMLTSNCCFPLRLGEQQAPKHLPLPRSIFLTEFIPVAEKADLVRELLHSRSKNEDGRASVLNAILAEELLELFHPPEEKQTEEQEDNAVHCDPALLLRTILPKGSSNSNGLQNSLWKNKPWKYLEKKSTPTVAAASKNHKKRKLPEAILSVVGEAGADAYLVPQSCSKSLYLPLRKRKRRRHQYLVDVAEKEKADAGKNGKMIEEDVLIEIEIPLLPQHLLDAAAAAAASTTNTEPHSVLFPLAAFPELLQLPPGATDIALGLTATDYTTTDAASDILHVNAQAHIKILEGCTLLWQLVAKEMAPDENGNSFILSQIPLPHSGVTTALGALNTASFSSCTLHRSVNISKNQSLAVVDALRECGVVKQSTGSVALVLDWSLSTQQASLRNPELLKACRNIKISMKHWMTKKKKKNDRDFFENSAPNSSSSSAKKLAVLSKLLAPFSVHTLDRSEISVSLPTSPASYNNSTAAAAAVGVEEGAAAALGDGVLAAMPCNFMLVTAMAGAPSAADGGDEEKEEDFRPLKRSRVIKEGEFTKAPAAAPAGLGFFMQLQRGARQPPAAAAAGINKNNKTLLNTSATKPAMSNKSTSSMSAGLSDFLPAANSVQTTTVVLPASHLDVLRCVQTADAGLLASVPCQFLPPGVNAHDFPDVEHLNNALRNTTQGGGISAFSSSSSSSTKSVLRTLAGIAILRQTAKLIIHHGIRAAHMYFSSSIQELPGIFLLENNNIDKNNRAVSNGGGGGGHGGAVVAQALEEAAGKVESGQGEDHPKHTALRQTLVTINTLTMGSKILVVGDPKSFFTLYSVIHAAGLRPCHLDREGQLLCSSPSSTLEKESETEAIFGEAVVHACSVADCNLAASELVLKAFAKPSTREVLLNAFQHIVIYVSETPLQQQVLQAIHPPCTAVSAGVDIMPPPPAAAPSVCNISVSVTVLAVHVEPLLISPIDFPPQQEDEELPSPIPLSKQPPNQINNGVILDNNNNANKLQIPSPVEITLTAVPSAAAVAATLDPDWPLVLSNSSVRPVKSRRELYEKIITLENEGTVIVERAMQQLDMVLSPSAALIILTEEAITAASAIAPAGAAPALNKNQPNGPPDFELFLQHIAPIFERIGRAFSKLHLVFECSAGFRAQLLCGHPRLVTAAARCSLNLQIDISSDTASTSTIVHSIATAYLQEWKERRSGLHYSIGDPASAYEKFLAAVPCLNPHSAALLAGCGLTLQQLFSLDSSCFSSLIGGGKVPAMLGLVPSHSMELFNECCAAGRPLGGGNGGNQEMLPSSAGVQAHAPPQVPNYAAPPIVHHHHAFVVDDLPDTLDEFITKPSVSIAASPVADGGGGGVFSAAGGFGGNVSADSMPAPSWCGPQLGGTNYEYAYVQQEERYQQQQQQQYHPGLAYQQQLHPQQQLQQQQQQQQQSSMYQEHEEVDEFGVPLDPLASWAAPGRNNIAQHAYQEHQQQWQHQQQQGYDYDYGDAYFDEQEALSGYAPPSHPPWIDGGMPLPGLAPMRQPFPQPQPPPSMTMLPPPRRPSAYYQQQPQPQQQQQPHPPPQHGSFATSTLPYTNLQTHSGNGAGGGGGGGGVRGYTAAALNRHQQQHSTSMWQTTNTTTSGAAGLSSGSGGADYLKRKWGGGRGTKRGGGSRGKGRKYSSRTQRQW